MFIQNSKPGLASLIIPNYLGGLAGVSDWLGEANQYVAGAGIDITGDLNPLVELGQVGPGMVLSALTGEVVDTTVNIFGLGDFTSSKQYLYGYSDTKLYRIDMATDSITSTRVVTFGDVFGFGKFKSDLYYANNDTQIGKFTPAPGSDVVYTDNEITGLTASLFRPMHEFSGTLWYGNKNFVGYVERATNSSVAQLELPSDYTITQISDYKQYLVVAASKGLDTNNIGNQSESSNIGNQGTTVFLWQPFVSNNWDFSYDVSNELYINQIENLGDNLKLAGKYAIYQFDGSRIIPYLGKEKVKLILMNSDSYGIWRSYDVWIDGTDIRFFGSSSPQIPAMLFTPIQTPTAPKALFTKTQSKIYVSGTNTLSVMKANVASSLTAVANLDQRLIFSSRVAITGVRARFDTLAVGDSVKLYIHYDTESGTTDSIEIGDISYINYGAINQVYLPMDEKPRLDNCKLRIQWQTSSQVVLRPNGITLFYEVLPEPNMETK